MNTFKQYLAEIKIARHNMPQVNTGDIEDMLKWVAAKGIVISKGSIDPKKLIPIQDIHKKAVKAIVKSKAPAAMNKPLLISGDNHLLDGHHRYAAAIELNRKVKFIRINLPVLKALDALKKFPKTEFRAKGAISGAKHYKELQ